jgi:uncharacterized membrane protein YoaK (UPF0700 family)
MSSTGPASTPATPDDVNRQFAAATFAIVVLLSATSGIVDAVAFARFGVFVANQTGNLVIVSLSLAREQPVETRIASVLALGTFTIGVFLAVLLRKVLLRRMPQARTRVVMLSLEAILIALTGLGVVIWGTKQFAYLAVVMLSLSQSIQAAVVTRIIGLAVQTVVINTALVQSAEAWAVGRRRAAAIAFGTPIGYLLGAFIGAILLRFPPPTALMSALITAAAALITAHVIRVRGGRIE